MICEIPKKLVGAFMRDGANVAVIGKTDKLMAYFCRGVLPTF